MAAREPSVEAETGYDPWPADGDWQRLPRFSERRLLPYNLEFAREQTIEVPSRSTLVFVGQQDGQIVVWAEVDPDSPLVERRVCATAVDRIPRNMRYVGSVQIEPMLDAWHVYC